MNTNIQLTGIYGDENRVIRLGKVSGVPHIWWTISNGHTVYGNVYYRYGKWIVESNIKLELSFEDEQVIIELVRKEERLPDYGNNNL